jgi:hypothetical protein
MSMIDGMATLVISSADHPAYYVTQVLGLDPDLAAEKGDLRPRQLDSGNEPIRRRVYDTSMWILEVESDPGTKMAMVEDDAKGFGTLQVLADRLMGRGPLLAQIRRDYSVELTWYGTASGTQTGFTLPSTLLSDLAELGLDVNCTVYAHDDTGSRPGSHLTSSRAAAVPGASADAPRATPQEDEAQQREIDRLIADQLAAAAVDDAPVGDLPAAYQPPEPARGWTQQVASVTTAPASDPDHISPSAPFVYPPGLQPDPRFAPDPTP